MKYETQSSGQQSIHITIIIYMICMYVYIYIYFVIQLNKALRENIANSVINISNIVL